MRPDTDSEPRVLVNPPAPHIHMFMVSPPGGGPIHAGAVGLCACGRYFRYHGSGWHAISDRKARRLLKRAGAAQ